MEVVILAGGKGTRMGKQTELIPKPMITIGGLPILLHIMNYYIKWGADRFIICCGYKGEYIRSFFSDKEDRCVPVDRYTSETIYRNAKVLLADTGLETGTASRLKKIRHLITEECFFLTYGDGVSDVDINNLLIHHNESHKLITISVIHPKERFGVVKLNENNEVIKFQEKTENSDIWINGGYMAVSKKMLDCILADDDSFESDSLPRLAMNNMVSAYRHLGFWQCMDTENERSELEKIWRNGNAPWL